MAGKGRPFETERPLRTGSWARWARAVGDRSGPSVRYVVCGTERTRAIVPN